MNAARKVLIVTATATASAVAFVPQAAGAATLRGTVVGRPAVVAQKVVVQGTTPPGVERTRTVIVVPVLLSASGERTAGAAIARVTVPATGGLKTAFARIEPGDLRVGDRVSATVSRVSVRPSAKVLRVTRRASTPSFARMDAQRASTVRKVERAIASTGRLTTDPSSTLDPKNPATSNDGLRDQLRAVRTDLNLLIADLRATADALDDTVATIAAARPQDPGRNAEVARRQAATLTRLTTDAGAARIAANGLDVAVGKLDETINAVGDPSAPPLPIEGVSAVSSLLYAVLDLLRDPPDRP